jgi:hypothetical protein
MVDIPFTLKGTDVIVTSHTRFLFRAERRQDVWRLSGFDSIYLRDEMTSVLPGQTIAVDPEAVKVFARLIVYCPIVSRSTDFQ